MTDLAAFGRRVSQERRHKGVREERDVMPSDIALALGVSLSTYLRWEAGAVWPREAAMKSLADYFGVAPAWLRYGVPLRETEVPTESISAGDERRALEALTEKLDWELAADQKDTRPERVRKDKPTRAPRSSGR